MDNLETNTSPSGEAGATASQGQLGANETQPVETAQPVSDGATMETGNASNPWDNDPKFKGKTPDDIYKAYKEAEKLTGQLSHKAQIANLIEEKYGVTPEQLKAQIDQMDYQQKQAYYAQNPLAPVLDEVQSLKTIVQQQEQEKALNATKAELDSFLKDNPAYEVHKDKIMKLALTDGIGFNSKTGEEVPFADIAREYFGEARAQGQQDAYRKIETKVNTQPTGVSSVQKRQLGSEDMKNMSVAELEAILPHA